ncbi:hypothetical protein D9611_005207 [Ephemerocybe angulata]|uniref:Ribosomal eL28/Mak16 domain-containing protein n=1 Tax=Ephemerocybe angulata TaxID=980116 RepID=A0A8H5C1X9_9AGAR|nr:hypothetical protein D9611_005207 [Tulosesus angulatus]
MSSDLQWLLLRSNSSFIVKRVVEGPVFNKEPGNLRNLNSFKFSGLANPKTIDVAATPAGITITTRKPNASPNAVAPASAKTVIRPRSGGRRALGVAASVAKKGYRPDLRTNPLDTPHADQTSLGSAFCRYRNPLTAALARVSALAAAQKEPKASPPKKTRGKKAKST